MERVTAEQCKQVVRDNALTSIGHHRCVLCHAMVRYLFIDDSVLFDASCNCVPRGDSIQRRTWDEFAETFNMQTPEARAAMWERFKQGKATHEID